MSDLEGVLVVALEQAVAAPFASSRLADAGARVIKIERAEGDFARAYDSLVNGESAYFVWLNRGKESVRLDLKVSEDLRLVEAMVAEADVFIQNLAPGAAARLGLGAETLTTQYPRLIYCSVSGYGEEGPYRDHKAYDLLIQGKAACWRSTARRRKVPASAYRFATSRRARRPMARSCARSTRASEQARAARLKCRCFTRSPTG